MTPIRTTPDNVISLNIIPDKMILANPTYNIVSIMVLINISFLLIGLHNTEYPLSLQFEHSFFFGRTFVCLSSVIFGTKSYNRLNSGLHNTVYYGYLGCLTNP